MQERKEHRVIGVANRTTTFEIHGLRELGEDFKKLKREVQDKLAQKVVKAAAEKVAYEAKNNVAARGLIDTSAMQKSIIASRLTKVSKNYGVEVWQVGPAKIEKKYVNNIKNRRAGRTSWDSSKNKTYEVEGPTYYWKFLEYGTVKYNATPFLGPALADNVGRLGDKMKEDLRAGLVAALMFTSNLYAAP